MEDLISVIVPIYRVEKYLPEGIGSIINQTYKNLETILLMMVLTIIALKYVMTLQKLIQE